MKDAGVLLLLGALTASSLHARGAPPALSTRPNIVFILADDAGPDSLGCYGSEQFAQATPRIDRLAAEGLRFTRCFAGPMCTPSRCQYLSGQYPFRNGCIAANGMYDYSQSPNRPSVAQLLKRAGYYTIGAGKEVAELVRSGLDEYISQGTGFYWQPGEYRQQQPGKSVVKIAKPEGVYFPDILQQYVLDRLDACARKTEPFYLFYSLMNPHGLGGATPYTQRTPDSDPADFGNDQALFRDNMEYIDKVVGEVIDRLEKLSLLDNTLILFSSDNGAIEANQSRMKDPATGTYRKIDGHKSDLPENREGACLVPLIANWPRQIQKPAVITDVVDFTDLLVTYADLAGSQIPEAWTVDGHSFAGLLQGDPTWKPREWIYAQNGYQWYVRGPDYRLNVDGRLFDMKEAPFGMTEVAAPEQHALRARYQSVLDRFDPARGITYESYQDHRLKTKEWEWKRREFQPLQQWLGYVSGDAADPDQDGVPNILERAFGWSPNRGGELLPSPTCGETTIAWLQQKPGTIELDGRIPKLAPLDLVAHIPAGPSGTGWELSLPPLVDTYTRVFVDSSSDGKAWSRVEASGDGGRSFKGLVTGSDGVYVRLRAERGNDRANP